MTAWTGALAFDLVFGEPPNSLHPVAAAGTLMSKGFARLPRSPRAQLAHGAAVVGATTAGAIVLGALVRTLPAPARAIGTLLLLKSSFALRALLDAGSAVATALDRDDLPAARAALPALVSRPVEELNPAQVASAAIESLAENLADSYVAPLLYYAIGGLPAALAYRVVNTADAMVGYHGRFEHVGKAAARADDLLSYVPARLTAAALVAAAPLVGLDGATALATALRDHRRTASPNAGWPMSAAAGALGVALEKVDHYRLGARFRPPAAADIGAATRLVGAAAALATVAVLVWRRP